MRLRWMIWFCLAACGPGASEDSGSNSRSGSDGTSEGPNTCEELAAEQGASVMLRVRNDHADPIFLAQFGCGPAVGITDTQWRFPECALAACESLASGDCLVACPDCAPGVVRIRPGGVYEQLWAGSVYVDAVAPAECVANGCAPDCHQAVAIPDGTYELSADVYLDCPFAEPELCECAGGEQDACGIFGPSPPATGTEQRTASFDYPAETTAELVVD